MKIRLTNEQAEKLNKINNEQEIKEIFLEAYKNQNNLKEEEVEQRFCEELFNEQNQLILELYKEQQEMLMEAVADHEQIVNEIMNEQSQMIEEVYEES